MSRKSRAAAAVVADKLIQAALANPSGLVYEAYPSRRWCRESDLPRGYCGAAYRPDDPRCRAALIEDLYGKFSLETEEQIAAL